MPTYTLAVEPRTVTGRRVNRLRTDHGLVPLVIYGLKLEPELGQVNLREFAKLYKEAGESSVIEVSYGKDKTVPTIIHAVDWDPVRDTIRHADLLRIDMNKEVEATVALKQEGKAPAVKEYGAVVVTSRDHVTIKCLPKDLLHEIIVDLSGLKEIGDSIFVRDLVVPQGVTILEDAEQIVVSISAPRKEEAEQKVEVAAVEGAEGAVAPEGDAAAGEKKEGEAGADATKKDAGKKDGAKK